MSSARCVPIIATTLALATTLAAAGDEDPRAIVKKVNEATKRVHAVAYKARFWGEKKLAAAPKLEGELRALGNQDNELIALEVTGKYVDRKNSPTFRQVFLRNQLLMLDEQTRQGFLVSDTAFPSVFDEGAAYLWMIEFIHPHPFDDELNADVLRYEGRQKIGGVDCHVIYVVYANNSGRSRWYFGVEDNLPHRVDRIFGEEDESQGVRVLELSDLRPNPKLQESDFDLTPPTGYEITDINTLELGRTSKLLPRGRMAPDWTLDTLDGNQLSLKDLRGKVVVLSFWASWCRPCRQRLATLDELQEAFRGQPVVVLAIHVWAKPGTDLRRFVAEHGPHVTVLVGGDAVAREYKVIGIPCYYIISPTGKIAWARQGFREDDRRVIEKEVRRVLEAPATQPAP